MTLESSPQDDKGDRWTPKHYVTRLLSGVALWKMACHWRLQTPYCFTLVKSGIGDGCLFSQTNDRMLMKTNQQYQLRR